MRRVQTRIMQKVFISSTILLLTLSATFILLYLFTPHQPRALPPVAVVTRSLHDATPGAVISPPVRLTVANIRVNALVNPVGLTKVGDMDIDSNAEEVAWYKSGPKPGEEGSAVIAGHYGWKDGVPSVFNDLNRLHKGDKISTTDDGGRVKTFIVTRTEIYTPHQDATYIFKSDDGRAHLNLVTCQGSWNNSAQTYSERLVVFTDLST